MTTRYYGREGSISWVFSRKTHIMKLKGKGFIPDFSPFVGLFPGWLSLYDQAHEVRMAEGITGIGDYAFYPYDFGLYSNMDSKLVRVSFPFSLEFIGDSAFRANVRLQAIDLHEHSRLHTIGQYAFASCFDVKAIDLSGCVRLESLSHLAFWGCESLEYVDLSGCGSLSEECLLELRKAVPSHVPIIMPNGDITYEVRSLESRRGSISIPLRGAWPRDPSNWHLPLTKSNRLPEEIGIFLKKGLTKTYE